MILRDIEKSYAGVRALDHIDAELREGSITAVLGESGAGKTTLLNVIAGLTSYGGTVDGKGGEKPKKREDCSYLFQETLLLPNLTAEGNLRFVLPQERWGEIPSMLARVGLDGRENARPGQLSGGEKQRVAVARAFLFPHTLLLMDEPFSSLDLALKKSMTELVTKLWQEKKTTVVFVTHDVREALLLAERALVLKKGSIAADVALSAPYPRDFSGTFPEERLLTKALLGE